MKIELTFDERRQLDEAVYKTFPEITGYPTEHLDRAVAKLMADRLEVVREQRDTARDIANRTIEHSIVDRRPSIGWGRKS